MKLILLIMCQFFIVEQASEEHVVEENGMEVKWCFSDDRIFFEMIAPTTGWLTIGFNKGQGMTGAYLLMGRVIAGIPEVVEHYTASPGNYSSLKSLGLKSAVGHVAGNENRQETNLRFSIPTKPLNKYARQMTPNSEYILTMAFSQADDFQHHSSMRTAIKVKL